MKKVEIKLRDGTTCTGDQFDKSDFKRLKEIFSDWQKINKKLKPLGGRNLNVPDVFSEGLFCFLFDAIRTNNSAKSYDCVSRKTHKGIQVKSASIPNDCTTFGPKSKWDELYYIDFAPNGKVDGKVWIYKINKNIKKLVLNHKKNETFEMQQEQGRRPRFSIKKEVILKDNLKPIKKIDLTK